jgi:hypothetical protein
MITIEFLSDVVLEDRISAFIAGGNVAFLALVGTALLINDQTGEEVEVSGDLFMVGVDKEKLLDEIANEFEDRPVRILGLETNFVEQHYGGSRNNSPETLTLSNSEVHALAKDDVRFSLPLGFEGEFGLKLEFVDGEEYIGWDHEASDSIFIAGASFEMKAAFQEVAGVRMEDATQTELALESKKRAKFEKRRKVNEIALQAEESELFSAAPNFDYDFEEKEVEYGKPKHYMARKQLRILQDYAKELLEIIEEGCDVPEWIESQITVASTYIRDAKHYLEHGDNACED